MDIVKDNKRTNLVAVPGILDDPETGYGGTFAAPGTFQFKMYGTHRIMIFACPGCGDVAGIEVGEEKPVPSPSWKISGTDEKPTLHPSIDCIGCCQWHGHLKEGVFVSC